ncbi:MAG: sugar phosphate nucleotidyltransferase [Candidatus Aminicenantes bacterium]|nr:sugar phosphate nucleotidyltransferase [Candidatus Aminicenantes bacterium]
MKPALVILAAGIGSRYGSLKQMDPVGPSGETIMDYSLFDARRAGFGRCVFIIQRRMERDFRDVILRKLAGRIEADYVFQESDDLPPGFCVPSDRTKPWGTSHAVLSTAAKVREPFAVINADDFYGADAFRKMAEFLSAVNRGEPRYAVVGYDLNATLSDYGAVARGVCEVNPEGFLEAIVERTHVERTKFGIVFEDASGHHIPVGDGKTVSMNFWGFTPTYFDYARAAFAKFLEERGSDPKAEFFIPLVVNRMIKDGLATCRVLPTSARWFGVTYKADRLLVMDSLEKLVAAGEYPRNLWI